MKLEGHTAIVTGGAGLLGKAFCHELLENGARVCVADLDQTNGEKTTTELQNKYGKDNCTYLKLDVSDQDNFRCVFEETSARLGPVNILINNAGFFNDMDWSKMVDINLKGVISGTMLGLELMGKDKGGSGGNIINVASGAAFNWYIPMPVYTATKAAVVAHTMCWTHPWHFANHGIRMNVVCPGLVARAPDNPLSPDGFYFSQHVLPLLKLSPTVPAEKVAEGTIQLILDDKHGELIYINHEGIKYGDQPKFLPDKDMKLPGTD